ncbi:AaceriABR082Wp [[Ashbya] aceris (nom. inval.)]|nr:AaceriABR082Wp [[Ashbya] aceris (nom. inval.)]
MAQNYNYQLNFWDDQEEGVRILLRHVAQGLDACKNMVTFFEERSKLEKDYSRKLSAIANHLEQQLEATPDYGNMQKCAELCRAEQSKLAQSHSKQAEQIYRENYLSLKEFVSEGQARYKTLEGKIRQLRQDKVQKRQMYNELLDKLEKAKVELREIQLNQMNVVGGRELTANERQLNKWSAIVDELHRKIDVLGQEYKSAKRHWLQEWGPLSMELQLLEESRIQMMKTKLQEFVTFSTDCAIHEQISMDKMTTMLSGFTAQQDIHSFAYNHGTGRIKSKSVEATFNKPASVATPADKHTENMRILSSKLSRNRPASQRMPSNEFYRDPGSDNSSVIVLDDDIVYGQPANMSDSRVSRVSNDLGEYSMLSRVSSVKRSSMHARPIMSAASRSPTEPSYTDRHPIDYADHSSQSAAMKGYLQQQQQTQNTEIRRAVREQQLQHREGRFNTGPLSAGSSSSNSNPTDNTNRSMATSVDSMVTSISSYASSIDDSQRLAKSWNSRNRRKSRDYSRPREADSRHSSDEDRILGQRMESSSAAPTRSRSHHRKSLGSDVEGALRALEEDEMRKRNGRDDRSSHGGRSAHSDDFESTHTITRQPQFIPFQRTKSVAMEWPKVTSKGRRVIGYARAIYSFTEPNDNDILYFEMGDHLLLTEKLNTDWYIGEVHNGNGKQGLIPMNYVELLS